MTAPVINVADLNAMSGQEAAELLRPACASRAWLEAVVADRPYVDLAAVLAASDAALAALAWPEVEEALAAHPRIGDRADGPGREAAWSRGEQAAAGTEDERVAARLRAGNVDYERRFGHVFLICATGRSAPEILAALQARLGNDTDAERAVVRRELRDIVRLRLAKTLR